ncbi:uncharacterized protein ALTATR162_LOCUS7128 [Alternaria atra]|uniref:SprT-like domain-containing protein n=1 Tax=Alternaria atra TaxID=119953 RepID=A0A8J2I7Y8_9PLEO|nr:uncharacterized protein ALTATR162_LOCUS7128 [Alternaria atra]CAG5170095.1 unnamed protein product [Alternaria atra]
MCRRFPHNYKSADPLNPIPPPDTPEEFINMVRKHHKKNRKERLEHDTEQKVCANSCDKAIAARGTLGKPGYRERVPLRLSGHHALRLCDEIKRSTEVGWDGFRAVQRKAYVALQAVIKDTSDHALIKRLGKDDANEVSEDEMMSLVKIFSTIFFPTKWSDAKMELDFKWEDWRDRPEIIGLYCSPTTGTPSIHMSAFNYDDKVPSYGELNGLAMDRLATILHELVHAYLDHYACRCMKNQESFEEDVDQLEGHGWAWQRIASLVERAAPDIIGLPLNLTRFEAIKCHWGALTYWPTQKEANDWQL